MIMDKPVGNVNKKFLDENGHTKKEVSLASRTYLIANAISVGLSRRQIVEKFTKEWGVSENYVHTAISEAINLFKDEEVYKNLKDINNGRLNDLYQVALATGKIDDARKIIDTMNKLNGLYDEGNKTQVNVNTGDESITITFGGKPIDNVEETYYSEVDEIINSVSNKKD